MNAILITGPTASGKSALAIEWAKKTDGIVINADSMQVYDTLRVLSARPAEEEMQGVEHRLYGHVPATTSYSTGAWVRAAADELARCRELGKTPVFVGGTGLYFKALTGGLSDMPEVPGEIRERLRKRLAEAGPEALYAELASLDAESAAALQPGDGQRVVRALEILEATGKPISHFQARKGDIIVDPAVARKFVVLPPRDILHDRINRRFEKMMESGAVEEVKALLALDPAPDLPSMKAIGVSQIAAMLAGDMTKEEAVKKASAATRQYAKRQMTWFRNQMDDSWQRL